MVSRLMINLRDPTLQRQTDSDGTDTASYAGHVSTFFPELNTFSTVGTPSESAYAA